MAFTYQQKVKFKHCDPARIVFFPRYFEMMNDTVEAFFEDVLGYPFAQVMNGNGVPTVEIEARFSAPSRLGDDLDIVLEITKVGTSSLGFSYEALCEEEQRFAATSTIVLIDDQGRPIPWDARQRAILQQHLRGET